MAFHPGAANSLLLLLLLVASSIGHRACVMAWDTTRSSSDSDLLHASERRDSKAGPRLLCWVMTCPKNHRTKAVAIKETWGPRCDILLFMSSVLDHQLPTVALPVKEGRFYLWDKTREAFRYLHEQGYLPQVDWVLKADDDSYMVVENLRHLLAHHDPSSPLFLGLHVNYVIRSGHMSGGPGYVLSRQAAHLLVTRGLTGVDEGCPVEKKAEDIGMALCMRAVNATFVDTRDTEGRQTFYFLSLASELTADESSRLFHEELIHADPMVPHCCSSTPVAFHYVTPGSMYLMDYILYHAKVFKVADKAVVIGCTSSKTVASEVRTSLATLLLTSFCVAFSSLVTNLWDNSR